MPHFPGWVLGYDQRLLLVNERPEDAMTAVRYLHRIGFDDIGGYLCARDLDLNRAFPGHPSGFHTERLADALTMHALGNTDSVIDLHGGGSWCVNSFAFQFPGDED